MEAGDITVNGKRVGVIEVFINPGPFTPTTYYAPSDVGGVTPVSYTTEHYEGGSHHGDHDNFKNRDYPKLDLGEPEARSGDRVHGQLAEARDRARKELEAKPWLNEKAIHIFAGENNDPTAATALWESAINRMAVRHTTLEQEIRRVGEGGYYAGYSSGVSPRTRSVQEQARNRALNYSNVSNYATDNSSNQPGNHLADRDVESGRFVEREVYHREHFEAPLGESRKWHESWKALVDDSENKSKAEKKAEDKGVAP